MGLMDREWYHKASEHNVKRLLDEAESRNKKQTVKPPLKNQSSRAPLRRQSKKSSSHVSSTRFSFPEIALLVFFCSFALLVFYALLKTFYTYFFS